MYSKPCAYCDGTGCIVPNPSHCLDCQDSPTGICNLCSRLAEGIFTCSSCGGSGVVCSICWEKVDECDCSNQLEFREELLKRNKNND